MEDKGEEFHGFKSVEEFSQKVCKSMVGASRAFQQLPPGENPIWDLRKSYPEFNRGLKSFRSRLVNNMMTLFSHANVPATDFRRRDVDEKMEFIVDANDEVLERIATSLDKAEGLFKRSEILVVNANATAPASNPPGIWKEKKMERLNNGPEPESESASVTQGSAAVKARPKIFRRVKEKPQLKFKHPPDNSLSPFVPKLKYKPNSLKPLSILPEYTANNEEFYGHPYAVELNKWKPKDHMMARADPQFPASIKETPFLLVENCRQMEKMLAELEQVTEIAVDLEHHSYRSFLGITCLIQISTRTSDYIVDTLALRDEIHHLNEVFTNPKILKIFHGATSDIQWLQKDFGVYVVSLFDTFIAAQALKFPQGSFQYLLSDICKVDTDKAYQLADWRLRPLPKEMIEYARKDTHYLLYIYDILKNRLLDEGNEENNLLNSVYEQSRLLSLKRYEKPVNNPQVALRKCKKPLNNRQLHGFVELFKWRDQVAREKDESLHYVLPNHMLLTIAETLPKEMTGILACCDPVPVLVNHNLSAIHQIVTAARELPMHHQEPSMQQQTVKKAKQGDWMLVMDSVHDVETSESDITLEGPNGVTVSRSEKDWWARVDKSDIQIKDGSKIHFGGSVSVSRRKSMTLKASNRITPYSRYKLTHEIIRNLKDPNKQSEMDLENPVIKSVVETILVDPTEEKEAEAAPEPSRPIRRPTAFDNDKEFVPFNPMSVSFDKKKGKKRKREEVESNSKDTEAPAAVKREEDDLFAAIGSDDDGEEEPSSSGAPLHIPVQNESSKKKGKSKKKQQRKNLFNKLTKRGKKRKYELEAAQQQQGQSQGAEGADEVEILEVSPAGKKGSTLPRQKNKRNRVELTKYMSLDRGQNLSNNGLPNKQGESSKKGGKKKNKGFFRLRSDNEGKSITFK